MESAFQEKKFVPVDAACVVALAILEYPERCPAASVARTRYEYAVLAESPVSEYEFVDGVPT